VHRIRARRLVPLVLFACTLAVAILAARADLVQAQSAPLKVFLVRHAEPQEVPGNDNPGLSEAGRKRAAALKDKLRDAEITAIFTSPFLRTQETAAPLAEELVIAARQIGFVRGVNQHIADVATAVRNHRGSAVLVVGHSNTVPGVIGRLAGRTLPNLCERTFDILFAVELKDGAASLSSSRYGQASPPAEPNCL
jgi:broad specificity phosphatase PhoE